MIELTDADWAVLKEKCGPFWPWYEEIAKHFLAAGIERAAKVCDKERELYTFAATPKNEVEQMARSACWGCAAAVRELLK
jgi:hypothetical protein